MRTRAKGPPKGSDAPIATTSTNISKVQLGAESSNPHQLFVLPREANTDARILALNNPKSSTKTRYFVCPDRGFYEFTKIAAPKTTPRSWLLTPSKEQQDAARENVCNRGFVTRTADLFVATAIDPLFLLLPVLAPPSSKNSESSKRLFLSCEDYFDQIISSSPQLKTLLKTGRLHNILELRMRDVCDTVDAGDETMYRLSEEKLLVEILRKATAISKNGLPASMEEKLVGKALEVPLLSIKREESSMHELAEEVDIRSQPMEDIPDTQTSTSSEVSSASSFSGASTAATSFSDDLTSKTPPQKPVSDPRIGAPKDAVQLLRLRTAFCFILSKYVAPQLAESMKSRLAATTSPIDFQPLDTHLAYIATLRQQALAARSLSDFSRKRNMDEDEESGDTRAEKKRKKEEEEKRQKSGQSRGVRDLKKVNVSGMKKMTSFFTKKA
ncbi:hypothetical protein BP5796_00284 [Coleophoma crateriformis]|uniref:Ribonuclease H2 subunit B n=1 Tax=Coleophoma crateriformis TaxID=565419 RepID=A0A3D8T7V9_9HELO|nr:hypothetical protein BP5796_00284 [Coleophoma crateriformis]